MDYAYYKIKKLKNEGSEQVEGSSGSL